MSAKGERRSVSVLCVLEKGKEELNPRYNYTIYEGLYVFPLFCFYVVLKPRVGFTLAIKYSNTELYPFDNV